MSHGPAERPTLRADAIVVAYRSADVVAKCVSSLRSDAAVERVIVVNNSPDDRTGDVLRSYSGVIYIASPANVGFGTAVNRARAEVQNEFVVIANPDTAQRDATVSRLLDFLVKRPAAGLVAPRMVFPDGRLYRNSKRETSLPRMIFESIGGPEILQISRTARSHGAAHPTAYVIASFICVRVAALNAIGWFDESIFLFGEDQDLCRRLRRAGWQVWFAPVGCVEHHSGHSWRQTPEESARLFRSARYDDLRESRGRLPAELYSGLAASRDLARRVRSAIRIPQGLKPT